MEMVYVWMSVEEAIEHFPVGASMVEVLDDDGHFCGYLLLESLHEAVQRGEVTQTIDKLITDYVGFKDSKKSSISEWEFRTFFEGDISRVIFNSLYDGVYITDGAGKTLFINQAYERITGLQEKEVVGKYMKELTEAGIISVSASLEVIRTKSQVTLTQNIKGGRKLIVSSTPVFSVKNEVMFIVSSVRDITELIQMKHKLDKQKLFYEPIDYSMQYLLPVEGFVIGPSTKQLYRLADKVAKTDAKVLLQGETGVGKSLLAKYIHQKSKRNSRRFVEINCGAIPDQLVESELFGYEPGAFTGALKTGKQGLFKLADGGTLFLDEIGDLPKHVQVKLLKVIEDQQLVRVGGTEAEPIDVRVLSATHRDLKTMVKEGTFREDLYYRLNTVTLSIPPLRERKEEVGYLLEMYLDKFNQKYNEKKQLVPECLEWLKSYQWPGNVRELSNLTEHLVVTTFEDRIGIDSLPREMQWEEDKPHKPLSLRGMLAEFESEIVKEAFETHKTTRKAAEALGISQSSFVQKMKKFTNE